MSSLSPTSPAQIAGYVAFVLGTTAFLQTSDKRLKFFNATQSLVYGLHFFLLGNFPAMSSSLISSLRSYLALRFRSRVLAAIICAVMLGIGVAVVNGWAGWLPVLSTCAATIAVFMMQGVAMRAVLFCCTLCWLTNNILSHSIGGTALEICVGAANLTTIIRMWRNRDTTAPAPLVSPAAEA